MGSALHPSVDVNGTPFNVSHVVEFFPKFHCEFNPIKMCWGWMKAAARKNCDYSFQSLETVVPDLLQNVEVQSIRRYVRRCLRFMDAYRNSQLVGPLLQYAMKKYNRLPPELVYERLVAEYRQEHLHEQEDLIDD